MKTIIPCDAYDKKVFTAPPGGWKAVNTFKIVSPYTSKLLVHLIWGYSPQRLTRSSRRYLFLYHTYFLMSMKKNLDFLLFMLTIIFIPPYCIALRNKEEKKNVDQSHCWIPARDICLQRC